MQLLTEEQSKKLKKNWGGKAESLGCYAEVRLYDPESPWECFIFAQNPHDEDEILCIISALGVEVETDLKLSQIITMFNSFGEPVCVDKEYRPRRASELFKDLKQRKGEYE